MLVGLVLLRATTLKTKEATSPAGLERAQRAHESAASRGTGLSSHLTLWSCQRTMKVHTWTQCVFVSLCILRQPVLESQCNKQCNDGETLLEISFAAVANVLSSTFMHFFFIFKKCPCTTIARNSFLFPVLLMFTGQSLGYSVCSSMTPEGWETRPCKYLCSASPAAILVALIKWNWQSRVSYSSSHISQEREEGKHERLNPWADVIWQSNWSGGMVVGEKCPGIPKRCAVALLSFGEMNRWET